MLLMLFYAMDAIVSSLLSREKGCGHLRHQKERSSSAHVVSSDRQVEFSYPPLMPDEGHDSNVLPDEWRYLPFLALPDGAHNYQEGRKSPNLCFWKNRKTVV